MSPDLSRGKIKYKLLFELALCDVNEGGNCEGMGRNVCAGVGGDRSIC